MIKSCDRSLSRPHPNRQWKQGEQNPISSHPLPLKRLSLSLLLPLPPSLSHLSCRPLVLSCLKLVHRSPPCLPPLRRCLKRTRAMQGKMARLNPQHLPFLQAAAAAAVDSWTVCHRRLVPCSPTHRKEWPNYFHPPRLNPLYPSRGLDRLKHQSLEALGMPPPFQVLRSAAQLASCPNPWLVLNAALRLFHRPPRLRHPRLPSLLSLVLWSAQQAMPSNGPT